MRQIIVRGRAVQVLDMGPYRGPDIAAIAAGPSHVIRRCTCGSKDHTKHKHWCRANQDLRRSRVM